MASDVSLDKADLAEHFEPEAGEPVLTERQIRLYIDNTPDYVLPAVLVSAPPGGARARRAGAPQPATA
jgi:hypothetical protein